MWQFHPVWRNALLCLPDWKMEKWSLNCVNHKWSAGKKLRLVFSVGETGKYYQLAATQHKGIIITLKLHKMVKVAWPHQRCFKKDLWWEKLVKWKPFFKSGSFHNRSSVRTVCCRPTTAASAGRTGALRAGGRSSMPLPPPRLIELPKWAEETRLGLLLVWSLQIILTAQGLGGCWKEGGAGGVFWCLK